MNTVELQILLNDVYQPVDIDKGTSFAFNLQAEDLNNPTITRTPFSVQVSLPKTHVNNHIFSQIWKLDSTVSNFNPLLRTDFRLYVNYNIFQSGYLKLEEITRKEYKIRLYGGLGDYFFTLSEIPLRELGYKESQRTAFGEKYTHTINRFSLYSFWNGNPVTNPLNERMNDFFGYAMTYQGKYDNFDSESYIENDYEPIQVIWENPPKQYSAPDLNEHKMVYHTPEGNKYKGEYRSYYQKPMMRLREVISQMFEVMETEHGWETQLDTTFFNDYNPYWNNLWMILPNYDSTEEQAESTSTIIDLFKTNLTEEVYQRTGEATIATIPLTDLNTAGITGENAIEINIDFKVKAISHTDLSDNARQVKAGFNARQLNCMAYLVPPAGSGLDRILIKTEEGADFFQYRTLTLKDYYPKAIYNGSNIGGRDFYYTASTNENGRGTMTYDDAENGTTVYNFKLLRSIDVATIKDYSIEIIVAGDTSWNRTNDGNTRREYGVKLEFQDSAYISIINDIGTGIRTDAEVSWEDMITSDENCVNFLLSYAKLFDLYFVKDAARKYVSIQTRNTYFGKQERRDWTHKVDYSKDFIIKPVPFEYRYGVFKWKETDTSLEENYLNRTSRDYGSLRFDTNYGFSDTEKDLLSTIFNNVVMATDNSAYYFEKSDIIYQDNKILPYFEDSSREAVDISFALVFFQNTFIRNDYTAFIINDDTGIMKNYGYSWGNRFADNEPSYVYRSGYPYVNRIINKANQDHSLDFGRPQYRYYRDESASNTEEMEGATPVTLYERFWRGYLQDRFNKETKQLTCYIDLNLNDVYEDLFNKFIFIDNTTWIILKIHNFDPNTRATTKVDLLSVQDMDAYISQIFLAGRLIIRYAGSIVYNSESMDESLNSSPVIIETSNPDAHTEQISLDFDPQMVWSISSELTVSPESGTGNSNVAISLPDNSSAADVIYNGYLRWGNSNTLIQFIQQGLFIEVTPTWTSTDASLKLLQITVTSNSAWNVSSNQSWLIPDSSSGSGNGTVVAAINGNTSPESRTGIITFTMVNNPSITATSTIVQAGAVEPETISVSPEELTVDSAAQNVLVTVTASAPWTANIIGDSSWFEISPTSGTGNATVQITIPNRNVGSDREVYIDFVLTGESVLPARFELTQLGGN